MRRDFAHGRRSIGRAIPAALSLAILIASSFLVARAFAQTPVEAGFRDFDFGTGVNATPTGEKPQSKVWWNDGLWWGILWDPASNRYEIHRMNLATQTWTSTDVAADNRGSAKADALWDGTRLYIAFHIFTNSPGSVSPTQAARLYRYAYDSANDRYTLDLGFPVTINSSNSEALVLAKDGTGQLWISWVQSGDVMVNHSVGNDLSWGNPYRIPIQGNDTDSDDISSIIALPGRIGVFWSNQNDRADYFAVHLDGAADNVWQPRETALIDGNQAIADDHINMVSDPTGILYVATKTSLTSSDPLNYLLRRTTAGVWTRYLLGTGNDDHTRPIVQLDDAGNLYVLMASPSNGRERVYLKTSNVNNISFPPGLGTPFISSVTDDVLRNPSGTKQRLSQASGMLIVASDQNTHRYLHNVRAVSGNGPSIASFSPGSGVAGTLVTLSGSGFNGTTSVRFNGLNAPGFIVDSATQIRVNAPAGATSGPIALTTPQGTATSSSNFTIESAPTVASFTPGTGPPATEVTVTGTGYSGTTGVTFNGVPAAFVVDGNTQLRATVPASATTGPIAVTNNIGTGTSASAFVVTAPPPITVFTPIQDVRVESSNPTTNYGTGSISNQQLRVRNSPEVQSYLKFVVSGLGGPVVDAKLRLFCNNDSPDGGRVYAVSNNYLGTSTPWTETGLVWNNAPGLGGAILDQQANVEDDTWVEFDVTAGITGNGTFSLGLTSGLSNVAGYESKEAAHRPELVVATASGAPVISSFTPSSGPPGTVVTVTGDNFGTVSAFAFNGVAASFTILSATQVRATLPASASSGPIAITNAIGTTTSSATFTVTPPTIISFAPTSGPIATPVILTGTQFSTVSVVRFNGVAASFEIQSPTQIRALVPAGATSGPISVVNPAGSASSGASFSVILPPTITSFAPATGPIGTQVTVLGTQFANATAVTFNDISASFTVDSPTQLRATVPFGASNGPIGVTNLAGTVASAASFTLTPPGTPAIEDFTPTAGPPGSQVAIHGINLSNVTSVRFNGLSASFVVVGAGEVSATVPAGATSGTIGVTNGSGSATSAASFTVTAPSVTLTFLPTDDARTELENPASNYGSGGGTRSYLRVRSAPAIHTYLKFNVTGLSGPATQARIRLYCNNDSPSGGAIYSVSNAYAGTSTPWLESGLNWNNAPAIGGPILDSEAAVGLDTVIEFDVTSAITGSGVFSFGMTGGAANIAGYTSRESLTPPVLVVDGPPSSPAVRASDAGSATGGAAGVRGADDPAIDSRAIPSVVALGPIRPNPFRGVMSFRVDLPRSETVRLVVFDVMGRRVRTLADGMLEAGAHEFSWNAADESGVRLEAGLYLIQLETPGFTARRKAVLTR